MPSNSMRQPHLLVVAMAMVQSAIYDAVNAIEGKPGY